MTPQPRAISVTVPFGQALERVRQVLFQPFDMGRWFIIGFCAWLAMLGQGGFHGGYNFGGHHGRGADHLRGQIEQARDYVTSNLVWIAPLAIGIVVISLVVWLVILFLSSRGRFMFLHCVALNTAEVQVPWYKYAPEANSLFRVRLVISLIGLATVLPLVGALLLVGLRMAAHHGPSVGGIFAGLFLVLALMAISILFWVVSRILQDFIVPVQFLRRSGCVDAWREFKGILARNIGNISVYLLFRIALAVGIAILVITLVVVTCCIAGCLFALPYLGTVFLLPVRVLERAYSLHYLAQFGPDYDVFSPPVVAD